MLIITEAPTRLHIIWAIHSFFPPFFKNIYAYSYTHTDRCTLLIAPNLFFKALKLHFSCSFIHKLKSFISLWGYFTLTHTGGRFLLWRDCYSSGILHKSIKKTPGVEAGSLNAMLPAWSSIPEGLQSNQADRLQLLLSGESRWMKDQMVQMPFLLPYRRALGTQTQIFDLSLKIQHEDSGRAGQIYLLFLSASQIQS